MKTSTFAFDSELDKYASTHFQQGTINEKKLFDFLYVRDKRDSSSSGASPIAHTATPCKSGNDLDQSFRQIASGIAQLKLISWDLFAIATTQLAGSLRISEVLNISHKNITALGSIIVEPLKGSNSTVVAIPELASFYLSHRRSFSSPFAHYNRFFIYRQYKKVGLQLVLSGSSKMAVTHIFRHLNAQSIHSQTNDKSLVANHLRHKSKKSTEYYV